MGTLQLYVQFDPLQLEAFRGAKTFCAPLLALSLSLSIIPSNLCLIFVIFFQDGLRKLKKAYQNIFLNQLSLDTRREIEDPLVQRMLIKAIK